LGIDVAKPHGMDAKAPGGACEIRMREGRAVREVEMSKGRNTEVRRGGESAPPLRSRKCTHNI
jgi:hypothetical protein